MTLTERLASLLEQARQLAHRGARLSDTTKRYLDRDQEAALEIEMLKSDPSPSGRAYNLLGKHQHREDTKKIAAEKGRILGPRLNLHFYEAERLHMDTEKVYQQFIAASQAPPTIEEAFRRYTNQVGVSADQILMLAMTEQLTITNVRAQLPTLSPSRRLELYRRAQQSPYEPVNAVTIRIIEETEGGYPETGPLPEEELTAVTTLGRLKQEARAARVPAEVAEVEKALHDVAAQITTARRLGAVPLNPDQQQAAAYEIEQAEQAEAAQAGAER